MSTDGWSRGDKIAVMSLLIGAVACGAALIVVPEARQWLGLDSGKEQSKERQTSEHPTPLPGPPITSNSTQRKSSRESSAEAGDITPVEEIDHDGVIVKYNSRHQIVGLSNLSDEGELCYEQQTPISGSIVKLDYDDDEIKISGFILEDESGKRTNINVETDVLYTRLPNADIGNLPSLFAKGKRVSVVVIGCGASGRVLMAKNIRAI
jgi:hypothetical protein